MGFTNVKGYSGLKNYQINEFGDVKNAITGKILKGAINNVGYRYVYLVGDYSKPRWYFVHHLVAATFLNPKPEGNYEIQHKDHDKINNHFSNLEWVTHAENVRESFRNGRKVLRGHEHPHFGKKLKPSTRAKQAAKKTGVLHPKFKGWFIIDGVRYDSARAAGKDVGVDGHTIQNRVNMGVDGYLFEPCLKSVSL